MLDQQNHKCYICAKVDERQRLSVDHCHGTGSVRKLLCQPCNASLGLVKENTDVLKAMIKYIEEHQQKD